MKKRTIQVYDSPLWKEDNICIRITGEDTKFSASENTIVINLDADEADSLAFKIGSLLQDLEMRKTEKKP